MKHFLLLVYGILMIGSVIGYDEKYENLDLQGLLTDEGSLALMSCFMEDENCKGELLVPREIIIEIFRTQCARCSPKQKEFVNQYNQFASEKYPEEYKKFVKAIATSIIDN